MPFPSYQFNARGLGVLPTFLQGRLSAASSPPPQNKFPPRNRGGKWRGYTAARDTAKRVTPRGLADVQQRSLASLRAIHKGFRVDGIRRGGRRRFFFSLSDPFARGRLLASRRRQQPARHERLPRVNQRVWWSRLRVHTFRTPSFPPTQNFHPSPPSSSPSPLKIALASIPGSLMRRFATCSSDSLSRRFSFA